jgi:hypothetical protein
MTSAGALTAALIGLSNVAPELVPSRALRVEARRLRIPVASSTGSRIATLSTLKKSWTVAAANAAAELLGPAQVTDRRQGVGAGRADVGAHDHRDGVLDAEQTRCRPGRRWWPS